MDAEWLSVPDVARRLNKDVRTVRRTIRRGELVAHQLDERTLSVRAAEVEAFIAKRRVGPGDAAGVAAGSNEDDYPLDAKFKSEADSAQEMMDALGLPLEVMAALRAEHDRRERRPDSYAAGIAWRRRQDRRASRESG